MTANENLRNERMPPVAAISPTARSLLGRFANTAGSPESEAERIVDRLLASGTGLRPTLDAPQKDRP